MTKAITLSYQTLHRYREKIFALLAAGLIVSATMYVFLLQKAIVDVISREQLTQQVSQKSSDVSDLESTYFGLENSITLDLAHAKGFKDSQVAAYISKKTVTAMASPNEL